jgi:hypothetical protein
MGAKTKDFAIVFADISGSTRLYDQLGDIQAREIVASVLDILHRIVDGYGGEVIKTIGDEIMSTLPDAESAARAAIDMHEAIDADNEANARESWISIRIGFHYGDALVENDDVYGDAVNVAARMAAQAKARQIMTTRSTADELSADLQESARFVDYAPIKGKGEVEIDEILWQQDEFTEMAPKVQSGAVPDEIPTLALLYNDEEVVLDPDRNSVVLGRSPICDIKVQESLASRQHVRIELRRDKFFIVDQSTNGSYIRDRDGDESFLRREQMPFTHDIELSLGRAFSEDPDQIVYCKYRTSKASGSG